MNKVNCLHLKSRFLFSHDSLQNLVSKNPGAEYQLESRAVDSTHVSAVVLEHIAVIHLLSLWGPQTVDAHREATSQSNQCSQVRHLFSKKGNVLNYWHHLFCYSVEHIESRLLFFLSREKSGHSLSAGRDWEQIFRECSTWLQRPGQDCKR